MQMEWWYEMQTSAYNVDCANHDTCADHTVRVGGSSGIEDVGVKYRENNERSDYSS